MNTQKGFTFIELIMVMVLLGILSALARDQWIGVLRTAQRLALLRQDPNNALFLRVSSSGDAWFAQIIQATEVLYEHSIDQTGIDLTYSNTDFVTQCRSLSTASLPMDFIYNGEGELEDNTGAVINFNQRLCILDDDQSLTLCLAPSGVAYEGACEP